MAAGLVGRGVGAERRKELEVALHAGALAAMAPALWRLRPDARTLALSLAPPVIAGYVLERPIEERLGGPTGLVVGLLAGRRRSPWRTAERSRAARRDAARRAPRRDGRRDGEPRAAPRAARPALGADGRRRARARLRAGRGALPGVSRTGATLAAARALGYSRPEASRLSFGVAGPVLVGATALKGWRGRHAADKRLAATGALAAFVGTSAALRIVGLEQRRPLWPYAAERAVLAAAILAVRYRRAQ